MRCSSIILVMVVMQTRAAIAKKKAGKIVDMLATILVSFSNETYPALLSRSRTWSVSPSKSPLYFFILSLYASE